MKIHTFNHDMTIGYTDSDTTLYFHEVCVESLKNPCDGCIFDNTDDCNSLSKVQAFRCMKQNRFDGKDGIWTEKQPEKSNRYGIEEK